MGTKLKDETGHRFGRLTVIRRYDDKKPSRLGAYWLCKCDCGRVVAVLGTKLRNGNTRSCGCLLEMGKDMRMLLGYRPYSELEINRKKKAQSIDLPKWPDGWELRKWEEAKDGSEDP